MNDNTKSGLKKMIVDSVAKFRIDRPKLKEGYLSPENSPSTTISNSLHDSQFKIQDIKRPLNNNQYDLSFKGLSFMPKMYKRVGTYGKAEFLEFSKNHLYGLGDDLLKDIESRPNWAGKLISVSGDTITINKKTIPHLAWDGIVYPFKVLPGDILNGTVELLGKIPPFENLAHKILSTDFFKNIRQRSKIDKKINSLSGMITYRQDKIAEAVKKYAKIHNGVEPVGEELARIVKNVDDNMASNVFQTTSKQFDFKTGNYDTKHERALNRLVSGLPPALFLANDAYNLSRMMDDDAKDAEKERKIRFRQETSRILTSGWLTLITMGAFQKFINSSKAGIMLMTGTTVLVTEMFSRLSNGKHITRLTPEEAREENNRTNAPEAKIEPIDNKGQVSSTGNSADKSKDQQKPLLSFDTLMKASAVVLGLGYGIKGFKNLPFIKNSALKYFQNMDAEKLSKLGVNLDKLKSENAVKTFEDKIIYRPFTQLYKNLTSEEYIVDPKKFDKIVDILRQNGYKEFADEYERVGKTALKEIDGKQVLDFGVKDKKVKPLVNFVIAPFKFMWNTVSLPYWMIDEKIGNLFRKAKPKLAPKEIDSLVKSFGKISKKAEEFAAGKMSEKQFEDFIKINMTNAFNKDSMSSVSNAELSNLAKTAASIATIWFLMTDNYNMVMLKSNGNDKDGASTKFKERFVQEGSRLFYQTLLIDLFNSTFRNSYNASLLGMSWVTLTDTTLGEILTRSSVGTPIKAHTRDELIAIEDKQNNAKGFLKGYYNFMRRLTGKRSIKTYEVAPRNSLKTQQQQTVPSVATSLPKNIEMNRNLMFQNNTSIDKMIKQA